MHVLTARDLQTQTRKSLFVGGHNYLLSSRNNTILIINVLFKFGFFFTFTTCFVFGGLQKRSNPRHCKVYVISLFSILTTILAEHSYHGTERNSGY
jgi:hypothetical protein